MGILRYFLALVVVIGHSSPSDLMKVPLCGDGGAAVQGFFVISGFYMAHIVEKYNLKTFNFNNIKNFYLSRLYRIYPLYLICIALTLLLSTVHITSFAHNPVKVLKTLDSFRDITLYYFSNIFILGQDLMRFLVLDPSTNIFHINPRTDGIAGNLLGSGFQWMGQSWTLALELTFYLLVPFVITRSLAFIIPLCVATFALRYWLYIHGYVSYNITVAFFPTSLGIFLLGSIAYKTMYKDVMKLDYFTKKALAFTTITALLYYAIFVYTTPIEYEFKHWLFIVFVTLSTPFLFAGFKDSKLDNLIGELSYPVYMLQFIAFAIVFNLAHEKSIYHIIILATLMSIVCTRLILNPLDKIRHNLFLRNEKNYSNEKINNEIEVNLKPIIN